MTKKSALQRKTSSLHSTTTHENEVTVFEIELLSNDEKLKMYERYRLCGDFEKDFVYLSTLLGYDIAVHRRAKLATTPSPLLDSNLCKLSDKKHIIQQTESGNSTPRSFVISEESRNYFKSHIEVAIEWESNKEHIKEIYIRGWQIDVKVLDVLKKTSVAFDHLNTVNVWNVGLTDETLLSLASCLSSCSSLKSLSLDGNTSIASQHFDVLLDDTNELKVENLSLRSCMLDNRASTLISKSLITNTSLLTLNLCFNKLGDTDADFLASSLRVNRTLLSLNLGSNCITDVGVQSISEAISTFPLTDEQVTEQREILSAIRHDEKMKNEIEGVEDSPTSDSTQHHRVKSSKDKGVMKRSDSSQKSKETTNNSSPQKRRDSANNSSTQKQKDPGKTRDKNLSETPRSQKITKQKSSGKIERNKDTSTQQEHFKFTNPLLEKTSEKNGQLWIPGNRSLINLNLSRNAITRKGVEMLYSAIKYQVDLAQQNKSVIGLGLLRLCLERNNFQKDDSAYCALMTLMKIRDPFYKTIETESKKEDLT